MTELVRKKAEKVNPANFLWTYRMNRMNIWAFELSYTPNVKIKWFIKDSKTTQNIILSNKVNLL